MKARKHLASFALIIVGVSGLAIAQQPNPVLGQGYYGQQAPPPAVAQELHGTPCLLAQLGGDAAATMPWCKDGDKSIAKEVRKGKNAGAPTAQEGDPTASQNQVEYGGGGM